MRRASPLLALLAVALQLTGLVLLAWVTGWHATPIEDELSLGPLPELPTAPSTPLKAPVEPAPVEPAPVEPAPVKPEPVSEPMIPEPTIAAPLLVAPPPSSDETPAFILELAERTTQIVRGHAGGAWLSFGFYPDGNIRMVDSDGGQYEGRAASARADMKEVGGARNFVLQIGMAADGRLQATFLGGIHDAETVVLETMVERPLA